jgi:mannose-1-phosphate guanylyltransferase
MNAKQNQWGVVLAGGEGSRVQSFLAALCGGRGIKQYCAVLGGDSLLERTLMRVQRLIPPERVIVIVDARHRLEAASQLAHWPEEKVIYQPANRETGPGILLPLAHILHRHPNATAAIFPSDHFIADESEFMSAVARALAESERYPEKPILLGITPDRIEEGYGWIETRGHVRVDRSRAVTRFSEKPSRAEAERLIARGALWNTFVFAAPVGAIWDMARSTIPQVWRNFDAIRLMLSSLDAELFIEETYRTMPTLNFSTAVLRPMARRLRVMAVPEVGWSDWGSVERILTCAKELNRLHEISARLKRSAISDAQTRLTVARFLGQSTRTGYAGSVASYTPQPEI